MLGRERFGTVIFDCDATLSEIKGIEELGREHRAELEALTNAAMNGQVPLEQVYGERLRLARPNRARVEQVGHQYVERLTADAREVIDALRAADIDVRIISSGVRPAVLILSRYLGIADEAVAAVDLVFDQNGEYEGYDAMSPLAASGGKVRIVEQWTAAMARPVMLVGDGATDLEAKGVVDMFVAFAGVAARPKVMAGADAVIRHRTLAPVLPLALAHIPDTEPARSVFERGAALLGDNNLE